MYRRSPILRHVGLGRLLAGDGLDALGTLRVFVFFFVSLGE